MIPDWPAHARVRAAVTTRGEADPPLPAPAAWLRQVHGARVVEAHDAAANARSAAGNAADTVGALEADASVARAPGAVCVVKAADCLPVLLADAQGTVVGAAHAGWRGLAAGVIEATVDAMRARPDALLAWLGPAIGPKAYEVGEEVRTAFLARDAALAAVFAPNRPGHWLLDLYAAARQRLAARGVNRVYGGGWCTFSEPARFPSWRRDRSRERIAAFVWLESRSP
ncbi:MAG TPA: peptidoglycan editing factor PgeF [Burkholderiales bacterium]